MYAFLSKIKKLRYIKFLLIREGAKIQIKYF